MPPKKTTTQTKTTITLYLLFLHKRTNAFLSNSLSNGAVSNPSLVEEVE